MNNRSFENAAEGGFASVQGPQLCRVSPKKVLFRRSERGMPFLRPGGILKWNRGEEFFDDWQIAAKIAIDVDQLKSVLSCM